MRLCVLDVSRVVKLQPVSRENNNMHQDQDNFSWKMETGDSIHNAHNVPKKIRNKSQAVVGGQ